MISPNKESNFYIFLRCICLRISIFPRCLYSKYAIYPLFLSYVISMSNSLRRPSLIPQRTEVHKDPAQTITAHQPRVSAEKQSHNLVVAQQQEQDVVAINAHNFGFLSKIACKITKKI